MKNTTRPKSATASAYRLFLVISAGIVILLYMPMLHFIGMVLENSLPGSRTFELVTNMRLAMAVALLPALALIFLAIRFFWGKLVQPVVDIRDHIEQLHDKSGRERLFPAIGFQEIEQLGESFNRLITKQDHEQSEAEKREQVFRALAGFSTGISYWLSPDRRTINYITPSCERITGYKDEEFYRDADLLNRIIHPDFREKWDRHKTIEGGREILDPLELAITSRDGKTVWVNHICSPVLDENGQYNGVRGFFDDVTSTKQGALTLKQNEDALLLQKDYLLALHETALGIIGRLELNSLLKAIISRAASLMHTEHGFIYLLNSSKTEMVLQIRLGYYETLDVPHLRPGQGIGGQVWKTGAAVVIDDYSKWKERIGLPGYEQFGSAVGMPLTSAGEVIGAIGLSFTDRSSRFDANMLEALERFAELASIAIENARLFEAAANELQERRKAEESLHKLTCAVEQSPVSIIITDIHGNIEYINPHFVEVTGYSQSELLGKNPRILKSGYTSDEEYRKMWKTLMSGNTWHGEFRNMKKNGELYWELVQISPIRDKRNVITHFIAVKEDIDDRKTLENQLRHSQKMEAIGQLAGGIAHDFNNILTAIIGYASVLQMKIPENSPLNETARQILMAAERGSSLTQGLLAFSRKQETNLTSINLNDIITRVNKLILRLIGEDIQLISLLSERTLPVMVDNVQIEQVLMNLVTNSRDAMPYGGTIFIKSEAVMLDDAFIADQGFGSPGMYALLSVTDTGEGMNEETIKRIFDPFYTTKETGKGTGLGLSIIYGIIKKHNGYINCQSSPGQGSTFNIYLPFSREEEQPVKTADPQQAATGDTDIILLAEDDEAMLALYKGLLEEFGYVIVPAKDGNEAMEKFNKHSASISLAILDVVMPGMGGLDAYKAMKKVRPDVKVLLCSGYPIETVEKEMSVDPRLHFLAKPYMPKELLMKIREIMEHEA